MTSNATQREDKLLVAWEFTFDNSFLQWFTSQTLVSVSAGSSYMIYHIFRAKMWFWYCMAASGKM